VSDEAISILRDVVQRIGSNVYALDDAGTPANNAPRGNAEKDALVRSKTATPSTVTTILIVLAVASTVATERNGITPPDPVTLSMVFNVAAVKAPDNVLTTGTAVGVVAELVSANPATFCEVTMLVVRLELEELGNILKRDMVILKTPLI
jgi:hypothetical protein